MYNSNVYKDYEIEESKDRTINIIIGNSADPSNNHSDAFEKIKKYKNHKIKIYCPLSYGNKKYGEKISRKGEEMFGDKFIPLMNFLPFDDYLKLLSKVDIAMFAHKRQQAMGNTISLLGLGKKIYMHSDVTQWNTLLDLDIEIFDIEEFSLTDDKEVNKSKNNRLVRKYFSEEKLKQQFKAIFEG